MSFTREPAPAEAPREASDPPLDNLTAVVDQRVGGEDLALDNFKNHLVMLVSGALTFTMIYAAFAPTQAMQSAFGGWKEDG